MASRHTSSPARATVAPTDLQGQMEQILALMSQRAKGSASNDQVEAAVDGILCSMGAPKPQEKKATTTATTTTTATIAPSHQNETVQEDQCNYDDDDDDDEDESDAKKRKGEQEAPKASIAIAGTKRSISAPPSRRRQTRPRRGKDTQKDRDTAAYRKETLSHIPMGTAAAKMMTTFGDGPTPNIDALQAALHGTRQTLQYAIWDARMVRRQATQAFQAAQHATSSNATLSQMAKATAQPADSSLVFRAMENRQQGKHDRLSANTPCGFDTEQLAWLFPEEIRAYERWNELHSEYQRREDAAKATATRNKKAGEDDDDEPEGPDNNITSADDKEEDEPIGGHLKERAAVFDNRTLQMPKENYLKFSRIRQGSFLPPNGRGKRARKTDVESEWEEMTAGSKTGKAKKGSWDHMTATEVRFLHWLGFEPPELPPPDDETAQALAFLGYDRMGRIVEQAIYWKNSARASLDDPSSVTLRELLPGEQLTLADIERALRDPDIQPRALYSVDHEVVETTGEGDPNGNNGSLSLRTKQKPNVQLYFGPGFEQRLELEMEEMLASATAGNSNKASKSSKKTKHAKHPPSAEISTEEKQMREEELARFQQMSNPPKEGDALVYLLAKRKELQEKDDNCRKNPAGENKQKVGKQNVN